LFISSSCAFRLDNLYTQDSADLFPSGLQSFRHCAHLGEYDIILARVSRRQLAMTPRSTSNKRRTIGLIAARVGRTWGAEFTNGAADAAAASDLNLIGFIGGRPGATIYPGVLSASYGFYDLVESRHLNGLIFAADIGHHLNAEQLRQFREKFAGLPAVSNALGVNGLPDLVADNIGGMRAIIHHLVVEHGYRRIAFIRGLKGQYEAEQRYQAYADELHANNIRLNENLVVQGDYSLESGRAATHTLIEARKLKLDVIACANDQMAFGALEALQSLGWRVPGDIALTGFDDVRETYTLGVPLTTVRQSFYNAGRQSVEALVRLMEGETLPSQTIVPTELIVRWSCGCLPENVRNAVVTADEVARTGRLENKREAAIRALLAASGAPLTDSSAREELTNAYGAMWDSFLGSLRGDGTDGTFLQAVEEAIQVLQRHGIEPTSWHNVVSMLRRHALAGIIETEKALRAENLLHQARMLVSETAQREQAYRRLLYEKQEALLQNFSLAMAPAMSLNKVGAAISQSFASLGIPRFYLLVHEDDAEGRGKRESDRQYQLILQYESGRLKVLKEPQIVRLGDILPDGKIPSDRRFSAMVMPLELAENHFGYIWMDLDQRDLEAYARVRNLTSSAMLRALLVKQREEAKAEVDRLLDEAKQTAVTLAIAREEAEVAAEQARLAAQENKQLYQAEQERRHMAETLVKIGRQLSSLLKLNVVPQQILEQLDQVLPYERGALFLEEVGVVRLVAHHGFPEDERVDDLEIGIKEGDVYQQIVETGESLIIDDVTAVEGWTQQDWLPLDRSWMGVPLFSKSRVIGMLSLTRREAGAFSQDDALVVSTFAMQAAIALENARLYDESTRFNELLERMVSQRVEELNDAYNTLEKLDTNKSAFISVAAHELRTPLTVMKGYVGMLESNKVVRADEMLHTAAEGVLKGTDRLYEIVNSMLDAARIDSQVLSPHFEWVEFSTITKFVYSEFRRDFEERSLTFDVDPSIQRLPPFMADPLLLQKAVNNVVANSIKFTPDGGAVYISGETVMDDRLGDCVEIKIRDTGIGIEPANHKIIFEKLYQLGKVELHSSGRSTFKGGGPGLGLAIASGIIKAHQGRVWVESPGYDEETCPGSAFFIRIPLPQAK
jgi:signal transduction histidine kinase/DNA-binding LacI/PurR family transcriptional regulator